MLVLALVLVVACAIGTLVAALAVAAMAFPGRPEPWRVQLPRRAAGLAGALGGGLYALGLLSVAAAEFAVGNGTDSYPAPACRRGFDADFIGYLSHHESSYLPLRFDCVRADGTVYASTSVYPWLTGGALVLLLAAALLLCGAYRARTRQGRCGPVPPADTVRGTVL